MMTAKPGSWIKTKTSRPDSTSSETTSIQEDSSTSSTETSSKESTQQLTSPSKSSSTKKSPKGRDPKLDRCTCGHLRTSHVTIAAEFSFGINELADECEVENCTCHHFHKKPIERREHLTNRPFADNTDLIILQDRLKPNEYQTRTKKGKRK